MSRSTVRQAVATWLGGTAGGVVTDLNAVYHAAPKLTPGSEVKLAAGQGSGAIGWVHIDGESEKRVAVGGPNNGVKEISYEVYVMVILQSVKPLAEDAQDDFDALIESMKERLRSNRQLGTVGTPNPVFTAGEGGGPGEADLEVIADLPVTTRSSTAIKGAVRLTVLELVYA